jgi:HD-GYP domain-containing protein (c-di-GMP phosphodiesterase class II)
MFARAMHQTPEMIEQHKLLTYVANKIDAGRIRTTLDTVLSRIDAANMRKAHRRGETVRAKGKIVVQSCRYLCHQVLDRKISYCSAVPIAGSQSWSFSIVLSEKFQNEHEILAEQTLGEGTQFLRAVTQFAEKREVVASEDIYSQSGIKLLSRGTQLTGKFYDRLVTHKLLKPIEQSLALADTIDAEKLVALAYTEVRRIPSLAQVMEQPEFFERLRGYFFQLKIPAPLALKLSVMQEERPKLFQHSLVVSMLCAVLGVRAGLPLEDLQALVAAGIFHDVGELFLDPALLAPEHRIDSGERRHLYAHPVTSFLMLRDFSELPQGTATAALRHHERMDGSGYPYGLPGAQIDTLSRYLAVAEFTASLLERNGADNRINMKLRLNLVKFDAKAVAIMCTLFGDTKATAVSLPDECLLIARLSQVGNLFEGWIAFRSTLSPAVIEDISYFDEHIDGLRMMVLEPGFDQCRLEDLLPSVGQGDSEIRQELMVLLDELSWQFHELIGALERKLAKQGWDLPLSRRADFNKWIAKVHEFIS